LLGDRFERIKHSPCQKLFERFWQCLDMNNQDVIYCRDEEIAFHLCAKENLVSYGVVTHHPSSIYQ
jgi:hypothetical protein